MMRIEETAIMDTLIKGNTKASKAAGDSFSSEMDKATGNVGNEANKTEGAQKPEKNPPAAKEEEAPSASDQEETKNPEDAGQGSDSLNLSTPTIVTPSVIINQPEVQEMGNQGGQDGDAVFSLEKFQQNMQALSETESSIEGKAAETIIQSQGGDESLDFVNQVMHEADEILQKQKNTAESGKTAGEPAVQKQIGKETDSNTHITAASNLSKQDDLSREKDSAGQGSALAEQNVVTAAISEDGKVHFQESRTEPVQFQQVQQKDSILSQVIEHVRTNVNKEKSEFFLQLKPEHLGGLSIMLSADDKGIVAKMMTSNHDVQYMLQSDMNQLQAALREKGIHVVQMEVIYDQTANSTAKDHGGQGQKWDGNTGNSHGRVPETAESAMAFYDDMSYYDMLAEQGGSVEFSA